MLRGPVSFASFSKAEQQRPQRICSYRVALGRASLCCKQFSGWSKALGEKLLRGATCLWVKQGSVSQVPGWYKFLGETGLVAPLWIELIDTLDSPAPCRFIVLQLDPKIPKHLEIHIDALHSRQPLVKGERLVRYEVNAVIQITCVMQHLIAFRCGNIVCLCKKRDKQACAKSGLTRQALGGCVYGQ